MSTLSAPADVTRRVHQRLGLHYVAFVVIYTLYGYQVCPYLDDLPLVWIATPAVVGVAVHAVARVLMLRRTAEAPEHSGLMFKVDFGLFIAAGLSVALFNAFVFGFPPISGGKVLVGFTVLGLYIALDLALFRDVKVGEALRAEGRSFPVSDQFLPYQTKFMLFSGLNVGAIAVVGLLVTMKDIHWALDATQDHGLIMALALRDIAFVVTIIGAYIMLVVRQYSAKIAFSLSEETGTLDSVRHGDLSSRVAVVSNDEFGQLAMLTNSMIERLQASLDEVARSQTATIDALVSLAAKRDNETGLHLKRTQIYVGLLADHLSQSGIHAELTPAYIEEIVQAAPLHDIGKVGIPDAVLLKPGRLTEDEFAIMQTHSSIGAQALRQADETLGGSSFIQTAMAIAASHHERWDGAGYPSALAGEAIPLCARIMAVADVYDALRSKRVYKPAMPHSQAREIILDGAGSQFDPAVVAAFVAVEGHIEATATRLSDDADEDASDQLIAAA